LSDFIFFDISFRFIDSFVISAPITKNLFSLAKFIASIVLLKIFNQTLFSAPREVLLTFLLSIGDGEYPVNQMFRHSESAVRIILPTL
jgi:hypothetical protein